MKTKEEVEFFVFFFFRRPRQARAKPAFWNSTFSFPRKFTEPPHGLWLWLWLWLWLLQRRRREEDKKEKEAHTMNFII